MQEASDAHSKTADSDTVSTYQVSSVQLVTDKKLEAINKAYRKCGGLSYALLKASSFLSVTNCTEETSICFYSFYFPFIITLFSPGRC